MLKCNAFAKLLGVYVVLSGICIHYLMKHRRKTRSHRVVLAYTIAMLIVSTVWYGCGASWSEIEFVEAASRIVSARPLGDAVEGLQAVRRNNARRAAG